MNILDLHQERVLPIRMVLLRFPDKIASAISSGPLRLCSQTLKAKVWDPVDEEFCIAQLLRSSSPLDIPWGNSLFKPKPQYIGHTTSYTYNLVLILHTDDT